MKYWMKVPDEEGLATHFRPRVMRRDLVTGWRSVDRGSVSRAIELRKKQFPGWRCRAGKHCRNRGMRERRVFPGPGGVKEPERTWKLHGREPRDPRIVREDRARTGRKR